MDQSQPLSWIVDCSDLRDEGKSARFEGDAEARGRLAKHAGVLSVQRVSSTGEVRPWAGGVEVRLRLVADVTQACVVSLEPVPQHIDVRIVRRFLPDVRLGEAQDGAVEIAPDEEDPPEPFHGQAIDLGPAIAEELVLALDPYPRAPGAAVSPEAAQPDAKPTPFAILRKLKDPS